jgi:hypothetical protein
MKSSKKLVVLNRQVFNFKKINQNNHSKEARNRENQKITKQHLCNSENCDNERRMLEKRVKYLTDLLNKQKSDLMGENPCCGSARNEHQIFVKDDSPSFLKTPDNDVITTTVGTAMQPLLNNSTRSSYYQLNSTRESRVQQKSYELVQKNDLLMQNDTSRFIKEYLKIANWMKSTRSFENVAIERPIGWDVGASTDCPNQTLPHSLSLVANGILNRDAAHLSSNNKTNEVYEDFNKKRLELETVL